MPTMYLSKTFNFDAAHELSDWPSVHGHSYRVKIVLKESEAGADYVLPLDVFEQIVGPVIEKLNGAYLNDIVKVPTMENVARWIAEQIAVANPQKIIIDRPSIGFECIYDLT